MNTKSTEIHLFLLDGTPEGVIRAKKPPGDGVIFSFPNDPPRITSFLKEAQAERLTAIDSACVYILLGSEGGEEESGNRKLYIGQADSFAHRIPNHFDKEWMQRIFLLASTGTWITTTHVKYLEHRLLKMAQEIRDLSIENRNQSNRPNISQEAIATLEYVAYDL